MHYYRLWLIDELHPDKNEKEMDELLKRIVRTTAYRYLGTSDIQDTFCDYANFTIESDGALLHIREVSCRLGGWSLDWDYIRDLCKDNKCYMEEIYIASVEQMFPSQEELKNLTDDEIAQIVERVADYYDVPRPEAETLLGDEEPIQITIVRPDRKTQCVSKTFGMTKKKCEAFIPNGHDRFMNYVGHDELEEDVKETAFAFIVNNDTNKVFEK